MKKFLFIFVFILILISCEEAERLDKEVQIKIPVELQGNWYKKDSETDILICELFTNKIIIYYFDGYWSNHSENVPLNTPLKVINGYNDDYNYQYSFKINDKTSVLRFYYGTLNGSSSGQRNTTLTFVDQNPDPNVITILGAMRLTRLNE